MFEVCFNLLCTHKVIILIKWGINMNIGKEHSKIFIRRNRKGCNGNGIQNRNKQTHHLKDITIDGKIILQWILRKWC
jgi:hypothetical protein